MIPQAAQAHYLNQRQIAALSVAEVRRLWQRMGNDFDESWAQIQAAAVASLTHGQVSAAADADRYVPAVLRQTGQADVPIARLQPQAFGGWAADGRELDTLMYSGVAASKTAIGRGYGLEAALAVGGRVLDKIVFSEVTAAGSWADQAAMTVRPNLTGYVRMVSPGACKDCLILAGKWFRWNQGFERHPWCNCRHIPAAEALDGDYSTDPYAYFNSLDHAAQDKLLGPVGAQTVRDGGDIYRVVNVQNRGLGFGKQARTYGTPMKLTPQQIYAQGLPREKTLQLLRSEGYITGPQVAGGSIVGRYRERFDGMTSVPRAGSARARVYEARATGVRDPLDRATMTAQERRLFDAQYQLSYARKYGYMPRSIGQNSADVYSGLVGKTVTRADFDRLEAAVSRQLSRVKPDHKSMNVLVDSLGLRGDAFDTEQIFNTIEQRMSSNFYQATGTRRR